MEMDNDANSVSESRKSFSERNVFTEELGDLPFFMQLPSELKLEILESVSGVDIAKVSCVCSELRNLASSDDLWKHKYVTQFGNYKDSGIESGFKEKFVKDWEVRKSGSGGLSSNIMRRNRFNPFGIDFGEDDEHEWLNIVRLCLPGVVGPTLRNEINAAVKL